MGKRLVLLAGLALVVAGSTATAIREASTVEEPARLATMLCEEHTPRAVGGDFTVYFSGNATVPAGQWHWD
jgi:hypothetical protein